MMYPVPTMSKFLMATTLVALVVGAAEQGALTFDTPDGWQRADTRSTMRVAQFVLPRADGDAEDAELIIYFFGGAGGSVEANLDRWLGQMSQPDGRASRDAATTRTFDANGLPTTLLDVTGTYVAEIRPGSPEQYHKPGFRLQAAVVATPGGPYFVKLTGPERTVARWDASVTSFLESFKYE